MIVSRKNLALSGAVLTSMLLTGCAANEPAENPDAITVAAPFYVLEYAAQLAGGDHIELISVTTPGTDPHDTELSPRQMADLAAADVVVYLSTFQPGVDDALAQADVPHVIDVADIIELHPSDDDHDHEEDGHDDEEDGHDDEEDGHDDEEGHEDEEAHEEDEEDGHDHGLYDPHFWTDPIALGEVANAIAETLAEIDPDNAEAYRSNQELIDTTFGDLDAEYEAGLATCERREFIPQHAAFGYLAERYELEQLAVAGLSPDEEPSPAQIAAIQAEAQAHGITTIFFEPGHSDAIASSIVSDLGLKLAVLDPIEILTSDSPGDDYPSIMRANLAALEEANGCS